MVFSAEQDGGCRKARVERSQLYLSLKKNNNYKSSFKSGCGFRIVSRFGKPHGVSWGGNRGSGSESSSSTAEGAGSKQSPAELQLGREQRGGQLKPGSDLQLAEVSATWWPQTQSPWTHPGISEGNKEKENCQMALICCAREKAD